jgi:endogenous inhibitor of DNA gyrase (YacG/DUF329 family)
MNRTCTVPECTNKHIAKGYCTTHYYRNIDREKRHPKAEMPCVICGTTITRRTDGRHQPTCSPACRRMVQFATQAGNAYDWTTDAMAARKAGATVIDRIDRIVIFDRDNWTCYLCHEPVTLGTDCYQPLSATIDHIIPFSKGGQHTSQNVATCCFDCNSTKQASLIVTDPAPAQPSAA